MALTIIKKIGTETVHEGSVGSAGSTNNGKGALTDDFMTNDIGLVSNQFAVFDFTSSAQSAGGIAISLSSVGTPVYDQVGFHGRETCLRHVSGVNDYERTFGIELGTGTWSIGCWYRLDKKLATEGGIFGQWGSTNPQRNVKLAIDSSQRVVLETSATGVAVSTSDIIMEEINEDEWYHFSVVSDGATYVKVYINGQLSKTITITNLNDTGGYAFYFGRTLANNLYMSTATYQDFFYSDQILTDVQINQIHSRRYEERQIAAGHAITTDSLPISDLTDNTFFWNLDETSAGASALDGSGNGLNLTDVSGAMTRNGLDLFGNTNAPQFDAGATSEFESSDVRLRFGRTMTLAGWFAIDNNLLAANHTFFARYDNGLNEESFLFRYDSGGNLEIQTAPSSDGDANETFEVPVALLRGEWNHFAYTFDNGLGTLYLNGASVGSHEFTFQEMFQGTTPFKIGARVSGVDNLAGRAKYCLASNKVFSAADIRKLYSASIPVSPAADADDASYQALYEREDGQIKGQAADGWLVDRRSDKIYVDFGGSAPGDKVSIKLNRGK